jgi:hypothetical protein
MNEKPCVFFVRLAKFTYLKKQLYVDKNSCIKGIVTRNEVGQKNGSGWIIVRDRGDRRLSTF